MSVNVNGHGVSCDKIVTHFNTPALWIPETVDTTESGVSICFLQHIHIGNKVELINYVLHEINNNAELNYYNNVLR